MKNILFIFSSPIDPNKGGVQRVSFTLAEEFERKNTKVSFLSLFKEPTSTKNVQDKRQLFLSGAGGGLSDNKKELQQVLIKHKITTVINQAGIYKEVIDLMTVVTKNNIQLITVHHNCVSCLNKRYREIVLSNSGDNKLWRFLDTPVIWTLLRELNRRKYGQLFKEAIKKSDYLVLLSPAFIPELSHYGIKEIPKNVIGIPNPVPFEVKEVNLENKENRIIFVGRLTHNQKRVERLMRIWKELHHKLPHWHFDVVGDGKDRTWMENFCNSQDMDRVHFHGYQDPRPFFETARIFTMTSDFEGFPMVLVEAQAYGVVPIAFESFSSLRDIITDSSSGIIIKAFKEDDYIKKVIELTSDNRQMNKMAEISTQQVNEFKASRVADLWSEIIEPDAGK